MTLMANDDRGRSLCHSDTYLDTVTPRHRLQALGHRVRSLRHVKEERERDGHLNIKR